MRLMNPKGSKHKKRKIMFPSAINYAMLHCTISVDSYIHSENQEIRHGENTRKQVAGKRNGPGGGF